MKRFLEHDWALTIAMFVVVGLGVMTLYSVTIGTSAEIVARRQLLFVITGLVIYVILSLLHGKELRYPLISFVIYGITLLGLVLTMFIGEEIRGATRWIPIGDFSLQFGEFAKVGMILAVASTLSWLRETAPEINIKKATWKDKVILYLMSAKLLWAIIVALPAVILLILQPSYGTAGLFVATAGLMAMFAEEDKLKVILYLALGLSAAGLVLVLTNTAYSMYLPYAVAAAALSLLIAVAGIIKKKLSLTTTLIIGLAILLLGIGGAFAWNNLLRDYHRERITAFLGTADEETQTVEDFQTRQALIAIGSGQMDGKGFAQGIQSRLRFLPDYHTDFVFAAYAEEFGFRGVILLLVSYAALFMLLARRAGSVDSDFGQSIIEGSIVMLLSQFIINLGMNMGLLPVLGIPLPLFSYGGSTLWTSMALLGIAQSFPRKREGTTAIARVRGWDKV